MGLFSFQKSSRRLKNAARLRRIVSVFARYGFQDVAEKAKLGRFLMEKFTSPDLEDFSIAERTRMAFEELGPTFVKLGQVLSQRPDLIPKDFIVEFKKLQDQVPSLGFEEIEKVLQEQFGRDYLKIFKSVEAQPLGAASIAQVHRARLADDSRVVIKVQRPGIEEVIHEDLGILTLLAELLDRYVPEARIYNPRGIVEEFAKSLEQETNFVVEGNNIQRFARNFAADPDIKIPRVYTEYTGRKVLVMEELEGIPLSHSENFEPAGLDRKLILRRGLRCYLRMVFTHGLFHGDLHAGNLFIMPDNKIGLIDFGVVGRLNKKTQTAISNMLLALAEEDYDRLAYLYVDLAPYNDYVDVDRFARNLRDLIAPYIGLSLRHVNIGRLLLDSTAVAARHKLQLPSELVLFFKSVVTIEGMGRVISSDFDFLTHSLEFASELLESRYEPARVTKDFAYVARDVNSLLQTLPRQTKQVFRKINSPDYALKVHVTEAESFKRSIESSSNLIFLGLVIGSLILSASIVAALDQGTGYFGLPVLSLIGYGVAGVFGLLAFYNYIRR
jgi:ubiquinone biosynthesis protein